MSLRYHQGDDDDDDDDCYNFDDVVTTVGSVRLSMDDASSSLSSGTRAVTATAASSSRRRGIGGSSSGRPTTSASSVSVRRGIGSKRSVVSRGGGGGRSVVGGGAASVVGGGSIAAPRRPLTANKSRAGYSSSRSSSANGGRGGDGRSVVGSIVADTTTSTTTAAVVDPNTEAKEMEDTIHRLLEESTLLLHRGDLLDGLDKAKEVGKLERKLVKHRDVHSLPEDDGADDLMFGTWFQLAVAYEKNSLDDEAMRAYDYLSQQRGLASAWKAQVNLGNAQYRRGEYDEAVRSYQMALDRIPPGIGQQIGFRVCRNLSNALLRLGRQRDATQTLEAAMSATVPECEAAFNLILCHIAKGDMDKAKVVFGKMLELPSLRADSGDEDAAAGHPTDDDLGLELRRRQR